MYSCAFPNTPKLRAVRALSRSVPVVRAQWLQHMSARRRLLPWRWYATEVAHRVAPHTVHDDLPDSRHTDHDPDTGKFSIDI